MSPRQRRLRRRRGGRRPSRLLLSFGVLATVAGIGAFSAFGYVLTVAAQAPPLDELRPTNQGTTSMIHASDGSLLGYIQSDEIRTPVEWSTIPASMREATVAIEDERFYKHRGVDVAGIVRAAVRNLEAGETREGGSTITQQLVRNLYIANATRDLNRKIREAKLAEELEQRRSKRWILWQYLNSVSYGTVGGRTAVGVEAAAQTYFSKAAKDLTLEDAAMLAGLPQAPSEYNPFQNPSRAIERRNEVLQKMARLGYISHARAEQGYSADLGLKRSDKYSRIREPFFFDYVKQQLIDRYGVNTVRRGGLRIHTTIDPKLQRAGRKAIDSQLNLPSDPSAAIVAIDPRNGYVRAMASSSRYGSKKFNLAAQGRRQPGSAFKTMVLTAAIRRGINPNTTSYASKPLQIPIPGFGFWKVKTYDNSYGGRMNLVRATLRSDNTVYAQLDLDIGPKTVRDTAYDMGIETELDAVPSEGLGGLRLGVSPLEMANAYATLASGGMRNEPIAIRKVIFPDGKVEDLGKPKRKRVFSDAVAFEVTKILKMNVTSGTGTRAQIGCPAAGKTGTTDNFNDAWFAGYTPNLSAAAWVGYPEALREMRNVHGISVAGGTFPAQIWGAFMKVAKRDKCNDFPAPKSAIQWTSFFGKYARQSSEKSSYTYGGYRDGQKPQSGTGDSSAGGGDHRGYDPRLYAPGAGQKPKPGVGDRKPPPAKKVKPPAPAKPPPAATPPPAPDGASGGADAPD